MTRHISEVQYNNWGNGVWNSLLTIQGTGDCSGSGSEQNDEYYKACIKKDIGDYYDLQNMWNSDYWKQRYQTQISLTSNDDYGSKEKFQQLGSWEKFREVCTKGFDDMIKKKEWSKLANAMGPSSSQTNHIRHESDISYEECIKPKSAKK